MYRAHRAGRVRVVLDESVFARIDARAHDRVVVSLTEDVADDMRRFVPVLSGDLKATIREDYPRRGVGRVWFGDIAGAHGRGVRVDYHLYPEYGTSRMSAQPYARPALYRRRDLGLAL